MAKTASLATAAPPVTAVLQAVAPRRTPSQPTSTPAEESALDLLTRLEPQRAFDDLSDEIESIDRDLADHLAHPEHYYRNEVLTKRCQQWLAKVRRRELAASRLAGLAVRLGRTWPSYLKREVTVGESLRKYHASCMAAFGQPHLAEIVGALDTAIGKAKAELDNVDVGLGILEAAGVPFAGLGTPSGFLDTTSRQFALKGTLESRLAILESANAARINRRLAAMAELVEGAGGQAKVAGAVREALLMAGNLYDGDAATPRLREAEGRLEGLRRQIADVDSLPGPAEGTKARLLEQATDVEAEVVGLRAEIDGRRTAGVTADVAAMLEGDEPARVRVAAALRGAELAEPKTGFTRQLDELDTADGVLSSFEAILAVCEG